MIMLQSNETIADAYATAPGALGRVAELHFARGCLNEALELLEHAERIAAPEVRPRDRATLLIQAGEIMTSWICQAALAKARAFCLEQGSGPPIVSMPNHRDAFRQLGYARLPKGATTIRHN
jgi:hypothetical protein